MKQYLNELYKYIPDKLYIKIRYYKTFKRKIDLKNPKTFNEKLQWLKLYDRKPIYTQMVDKYEVRKYISERIGEEYLIPLLGIWNSVEEIDFNKLPNQFVLKTTHDSGGIVICKDKKIFNEEEAKQKLLEHFEINYYYSGREWPYKNVKPRIIAEKYMVDESNKELKDYKLFCFNGKVEIIQVDYGRFSYHKRNIYDVDWNLLKIKYQYDYDELITIKKPAMLGEMINISEKLSTAFPFCRIDFYSINNQIFIGEITFYPEAGFSEFIPNEWNYRLGDLIDLSYHSK